MKLIMPALPTLAALFLSSIATAQIKWHDPMSAGSDVIAGRGWGGEIGQIYTRLPERIKNSVRPQLWDLSRNSAGLYISFVTNSPQIRVRYKVSGNREMYHMPLYGVSGVDLYSTNADGVTGWCRPGWPELSDTLTFTFNGLVYRNNHDKGNEYKLYLPLYNTVTWLEVGVEKDADFRFLMPPTEKPIVVYGTSIAQGACASRPGMAWTNILERMTETPVVNLGFSGNGKHDIPLFSMLSEIDAALYVIDCLPNLVREDMPMIHNQLIEGVKIIRSRTSAPILLAEHSGYMNDITVPEVFEAYDLANKELRRTYDTLLAMGIEGLHYIIREEIGLSREAQVDGVHPNDIGMMQYAVSYAEACRRILGRPNGSLPTTIPVRHNRDAAAYDWRSRHEGILKDIRRQQPEIVMIGNSITHFWGDSVKMPLHRGYEVWSKLFAGRLVANIGCGWDRIENVLWRIYHGEIDGIAPKKIFLKIGTNNTGVNSVEEIVEGIANLAVEIRRRQPDAKLYIINILPRVDNMEKVKAVNEAVNRRFAGSGVQTINIGAALEDKNGNYIPEYLSDGVHPNGEGYELIAKELSKYL